MFFIFSDRIYTRPYILYNINDAVMDIRVDPNWYANTI